MREVVATVEKGQIKLPPSVSLPDGTKVLVAWEEPSDNTPPIEREPLTEEDVMADVRWASGKQFSK